MMKRILLAVICTVMFAQLGWTDESDRASKPEAIGVGGGAAIGGVAGGPVGLILGAALGGWLGDRFHDERTARVDYAQRWEAVKAEADTLNGLVRQSEREVARLESELRTETITMRDTVREALNIQVLFRTGESELADVTQERLGRLAELLARMDGMLIRVEGFADPRGDAEYNEQLSAERAVAVRDTLIRAGVPAERITVDSYGERRSSAEEEDLDALAMERRVQLTLIDRGETQRIAQK